MACYGACWTAWSSGEVARRQATDLSEVSRWVWCVAAAVDVEVVGTKPLGCEMRGSVVGLPVWSTHGDPGEPNSGNATVARLKATLS